MDPSMFDPSMVAAAQAAMSKMTPAQIAALQQQAASMDPGMMQQAMNMYSTMSPEQRASMASMTANMEPETLTQQATNAQSQLSAQQKYQHSASLQLKNEGNKLHGAGQYKLAAEKYARAVSNLAGHSAAESATLRTSCQSNLASCYLQLQEWQDCVDQCNAVLATDAANRKALYRRGQALTALNRANEAVRDLQRALAMSPEAEKAIVGEKLQEAQQKQKQGAQGVTIEQLDGVEEAGGDDSDDNMPPLIDPLEVEEVPLQPSVPPAANPAAFSAGGMPLGESAAEMAAVSEMLKSDPTSMQRAAEAMENMSDAELAAYMAQGRGQMPGMSLDMARSAAAMMKQMPAEQIQGMVGLAAATGVPAASNSGGGGGPSMAAQGQMAAEVLRKDPNAMKTAAKMMESMSPEQLESMAQMMPGAPAGMKIDAQQLKFAAKMMENLSPEDLERMSAMAQSVGIAPVASAAAGAGAPGASAPTGKVEASGVEEVGVVPSTGPVFPAAGAGMGTQTMAQMRQQLADPAMLRTMRGMLKDMDPVTLSSMLGASGMNMTPEQAQSMMHQMESVSDRQLVWISRVTTLINFIIDTYQRIRAWAAGNAAMALALVVLLVAIFLRWRGWM